MVDIVDDRQECTKICSILKPTKSIQVVVKNEQGKSVYASILTACDSECFYVSSPAQGQSEVALKESDAVQIVYFANDAIYEFESQVMGFRLDQYGTREYQLLIPKKGWRLQRRNFYRLPFHIHATYRLTKEEKNEVGTMVVPFGESKDCLIGDLSGGGVGFYTREVLDLDGCVEVTFPISVDEAQYKVNEIVKVVRVQPISRKNLTSEYEYACGAYYFAIDEKLRSDILRFVMQKQIELYGKKK